MKKLLTMLTCFGLLVVFALTVFAGETEIETIKGVVERLEFNDPSEANPFNFQVGVVIVQTEKDEPEYRFPIFSDTALRDRKWRNVNILSIQTGDKVEVEFVRKSDGELRVRSLLVLTSKEWEDDEFRTRKNYNRSSQKGDLKFHNNNNYK